MLSHSGSLVSYLVPIKLSLLYIIINTIRLVNLPVDFFETFIVDLLVFNHNSIFFKYILLLIQTSINSFPSAKVLKL